jgi:hypothetical protein
LTNINGPTSDLVVSSTNCGPSAAAVFVDEFDAGYFLSRRSPTRIIGQKDDWVCSDAGHKNRELAAR